MFSSGSMLIIHSKLRSLTSASGRNKTFALGRAPVRPGCASLRRKQWTSRDFQVASGDLWVPGQAAARKRCTDELLSQQNCVHCAQQLKGGIQLREVARCTSAQGFASILRIVVSGQEH